MQPRNFIRFLTSILLLGSSAAVFAQMQYVSDELVITLRTGPSTQNAITRNLVSGDRVEVLEELPDEGYTRVRLEDGDEGWVLSRYLQPEQTGDQLFAAEQRQRESLQQQAESLAEQVAELTAELEAARQSLGETESTNSQLATELEDIREASANALTTRDQNASLRLRISELTAQSDLAQAEIRELRSRNRQSWFIVGAAVLFGGIVIGLVAPSLRRKRRSSW